MRLPQALSMMPAKKKKEYDKETIMGKHRAAVL